MLAVGLLTRPMLAVAISLHLPKGFFAGGGGVEFTARWTVALAYFAFQGAGPYSVDAKIGREV
jgi:uncharacterized membrane protein YphA (DoxX/SURF4 family)